MEKVDKVDATGPEFVVLELVDKVDARGTKLVEANAGVEIDAATEATFWIRGKLFLGILTNCRFPVTLAFVS